MKNVKDFETNKIYLGDTVHYLKQLPDNYTELIIADPPYGLGKNFGNGKIWNDASEWFEWCKLWLSECKRVLTEEGSIFVYGIHRTLCYLQCYLYELDLKYRRQFIWHYENGWASFKNPSAFIPHL